MNVINAQSADRAVKYSVLLMYVKFNVSLDVISSSQTQLEAKGIGAPEKKKKKVPEE